VVPLPLWDVRDNPRVLGVEVEPRLESAHLHPAADLEMFKRCRHRLVAAVLSLEAE
jgi:hypothetical protein